MLQVDSEILMWVLYGLMIIGAMEVLWSIGFVLYKVFVRVKYHEIVELEAVYYDADAEEEES